MGSYRARKKTESLLNLKETSSTKRNINGKEEGSIIMEDHTKQTSFKQYGLREGDHVVVHYEKGNNGWDFGGRIDDFNDVFMSVMVGRFDEVH